MLGPRYDSHSTETGVPTDWGPDGLRVVWTHPTGTGYGNGVAAAGRWFQFDRYGNVERLTCFKAETGEKLWQWEAAVEYRDAYGYNDGPRCSPVVEGDRVYVYGVAGRLSCIAVVDGTELWSRDMNQEYHVVPNFFGVGAGPLIQGDLLIAMVGGSPASGSGRSPTVNDMPRARPDGTAIVAFDKRTGQEKYRVGNYLASYSAPMIATLDGVPHCVALVREGLLVFRADDGSGEAFFPWRAATIESVNAATPVVIGNRIFISEAYEIGCALLEFTDGKLNPLWKDSGGRSQQVMRTHWATPVQNGNFLFASSGRNPPDTDMRCIEILADGKTKVRWNQRNRDRGTSMVVDSHLLWLGENGKLQLMPLDPDAYRVTASMDLQSMMDPIDGQPLINSPSWAPPVLAHGLLYLRGADRIVCLELIAE